MARAPASQSENSVGAAAQPGPGGRLGTRGVACLEQLGGLAAWHTAMTAWRW